EHRERCEPGGSASNPPQLERVMEQRGELFIVNRPLYGPKLETAIDRSPVNGVLSGGEGHRAVVDVNACLEVGNQGVEASPKLSPAEDPRSPATHRSSPL